MNSLLIITLCLSFLTTLFGTPIKVKLPSYQGPPLDIYSGYITVDDVNGRALHYILIKAETEPDDAPLLVWYQGGPGCSGLIGLFQENGPFSVSRDSTGKTTVSYDNLGWTQFANVLWVEQPAFVGFSYSNTSSDINTNDTKSSLDNHIFVKNFIFTEFPEYIGRDLWFTGESYGGVYVPMLSDLVVGDSDLIKQFKGFMIGNPVFSCLKSGEYLNLQINILYWHGLASYVNYLAWTTTGCTDPSKAVSDECKSILNLVYSQVGEINQQLFSLRDDQTWPSVDPDNIFQDFCTGNGTLEFVGTPPPNAPCEFEIGNLVQEYLNRVDVQTVLGVKPTNWAQCSNLNYNTNVGSTVPFYEDILKKKPDTSLLVYSGDLDILTIPFAFTEPCLYQLFGTPKTLWQPWFVNGATAGYYEVYDSCTYATVKGGGHETPQYQPLSSFQMINRFLINGTLSNADHLPTKSWRKERLTQSMLLKRAGVHGF